MVQKFLQDGANDGTDGTFAQVQASSVAGLTTSGLVSIVAYLSSQTVTIPSGATRAWIKLWGASGGSGGVSGQFASGGTGAGGYLEKFLTGLTPGNTLTLTIGAAGAAGTSGGGNGGNGGVSTLASGTQTISTLTANGSNGSIGVTSGTTAAGTAGGTASGGDLNLQGANGGAGFTTADLIPGSSGDNLYSPGADGVAGTSAGIAGKPGGMIVSWYS